MEIYCQFNFKLLRQTKMATGAAVTGGGFRELSDVESDDDIPVLIRYRNSRKRPIDRHDREND